MKLYIKKIHTVLLFAMAATVVSCDIDDIKPYNKLTTENTVRDEASAQLVLNGVYDLGKEFDVSFFPLHLAAYGNEGLITGFMSGSKGFNTNEVPVDNIFLTNLYSGHYKIINGCNFLIQELEAAKAVGISDVKKAEMISEAKFQRAFAHFNLLRYFGEFYDLNSTYGIVVRTAFATKLEAKPRNSVSEVYQQIEDDLVYASANGPVYIDHFYSGSLAAKALLSKVYLYTGKFTEAAALADEVINNDEGYVLESQYSDIFKNSFNSSEVIFAPKTGPDNEGKTAMNQVSRTTYSQALKTLADAQVGTSTDGTLSGAGSGYDPRFLHAYADATKKTNGNGKYPFLDQIASQGNTLYHLRLGEIYLIKAEAEVRKTGGDLTIALESLNAIRERAGVNLKSLSDKATLLEDIRKEKLLELFFENGESWFDIVRYDHLGNLRAAAVKASLLSPNQFVLPIPLQVIIGNKTVIQNKGY
ncbi:RagB/SusD family nutrient uptake outer membrane protein [Flavobacterium granuli]|uniref:SusD family protein n=1 Tax=Flavobacterium granuli TaxID=280093 RepID=A0A1M5IXQ7_9FLAO|nr:RagB/SusD family nutrient uptake outer membrane protein [Flavobacterium granuli]PRZ28154.1 SusD-like starch-binding protein associating with outer membrane [Flavobacterium granuli]SHG33148.1 SusD family protein [Flavobacterium granuli]